jgi:hypothetical protein
MATIKRKIKVRQGTAATRPTLASGEIGFDTDTYGVWMGNGTTNMPMGIPVKKYVALLTQSGTSAPVATVLENTLGGTVVWSYVGVGTYYGTLASAFTQNKTVVNIGFENNWEDYPSGTVTIASGLDTTNTIVLISAINNVASNNAIASIPITVIVYP